MTDSLYRIPCDRFLGVYLAFLIHGIGCFLPWNLLLHCYSYFICCRFISDESSIYRRHFLSFCAFSTLLAACVATGVGLFLGFTGDTKRRISPCIVVLVLMFIIQVLFAIFDAKDASGVFLCVTILNIVIIGAFIGLYISSIFGVASYFPDKYANAIVVGTSIGILLAVISRIIAKEITTDARVVAIYFLVTAVIILLLCFDVYFALPYSRFFRFYHTSVKIDLLHNTKGRLLKVAYADVFKQIWLECLATWLHYITTITLFPAVLSEVKSLTPTFFLDESYFVDGIVLLSFAVFNLVGNILAGCVKKPYSRWLSVGILLRAILFLIIFMFTNFEPNSRSTIPVTITNDYWFWTIVILFSLTHGYFNSMLNMYTSKLVEPHLSPTAAVMLHLFVFFGAISGVVNSVFYRYIIIL